MCITGLLSVWQRPVETHTALPLSQQQGGNGTEVTLFHLHLLIKGPFSSLPLLKSPIQLFLHVCFLSLLFSRSLCHSPISFYLKRFHTYLLSRYRNTKELLLLLLLHVCLRVTFNLNYTLDQRSKMSHYNYILLHIPCNCHLFYTDILIYTDIFPLEVKR